MRRLHQSLSPCAIARVCCPWCPHKKAYLKHHGRRGAAFCAFTKACKSAEDTGHFHVIHDEANHPRHSHPILLEMQASHAAARGGSHGPGPCREGKAQRCCPIQRQGGSRGALPRASRVDTPSRLCRHLEYVYSSLEGRHASLDSACMPWDGLGP